MTLQIGNWTKLMLLASSSSSRRERSSSVFDNDDDFASPKRDSCVSSPLPRAHQSMSTLQASSLENGGCGAPGEAGADEDERKQPESHKKRSKNWTRPESLLLIRLRTQLEARFAKSGRKTELWDEIADALQREGYTRDAQQCRDKWEKLTAGYKEVRDGMKEKDDNPFYDELHALLSGKSIKREQHQQQQQPHPKSSTAMEVEEDEEPADEPERKKTRYMPVTDVEAVLETIITRQQEFFRELLDAMERKEQMRQEKEDKWRAEERAQRGVFNNAMIVLTQKLVGEQLGAAVPIPTPPPPPPTTTITLYEAPHPHSPEVPKRRSKNWKRAEVLQLIKLRGEMDSRFAHSTRRAALWDELAERLVGQGIKRDGKQCREKWDKLMAEYKDVTDGKRDQRESPYYSELTTILARPVEAP